MKGVKIKAIIFLVILIMMYLTLAVCKVDRTDRSALFHVAKNCNRFTSAMNDENHKMHMLKLFLTPFKSKNYFARISHGKAYEGYIASINPKLAHQMKSRVFWYYVLEKFKIPQLKISVECDETHCIFHKEIVPDYEYLERNDFGDAEMRFVKGNEIAPTPGQRKMWQESDNCLQSVHKMFHIVTLGTKVFGIWEVKKTKNEKAMKNNWTVQNVPFESFSNYEMTEHTDENIALFSLSTKLFDLHKAEFEEVFCIGWDIVSCKDSLFVMECNTHPLSMIEETNDKKQIKQSDEIINSFKDELQAFL